MPLVTHTSLPIYEKLRRSGCEVLAPEDSAYSSSPEIRIGLLNMMPDAALAAAELQFMRLIGRSTLNARFFTHVFSLPDSLDPRRGRRPERVRAVRTRAIEFGHEEIDVSLLYQLVDAAQCRMIGDLLLRAARGLCDGRRHLPGILAALETDLEAQGLDALVHGAFGDRARPRRFEVAAALNRLRSLRVAPSGAARPRPPASSRPNGVSAADRRESRDRGRRQH